MTPLVLTFALGTGGVVEGRPTDKVLLDDHLLAEYGDERLVREIYDSFAAKATLSGYRIRIAPEDFRTFLEGELSAVSLTEVLTRPYERYLDVRPESFRHGRGAVLTTLRIGWREVSVQRRDSLRKTEREAQTLSVHDAVDWVRANVRPEAELPDALTTYTVEVDFDGIMERYRALAAWYFRGDGTARLELHDAMVPSIDTLYLMDATLAAHSVAFDSLRLLRRLEQVQRGLPEPWTKASQNPSCETGSTTHTANQVVRNENSSGHSSGKHFSLLRIQRTCDYNQDCTVECTPTPQSQGCTDSGEIEGPVACYAKIATNSQVGAGSGYNEAVSCAVALACGVKHCCLGGCGGMSITFGGSGASVSASVSGADYQLSVSQPLTCPPPTVLDTGGDDDGGGPCSDPAACDSPILLDMGRRGLELGGVEDGVLFDIDADGVAEIVSWPDAGSPDVFLALDRNRNGRIDSGLELFGNFTPQDHSEHWPANGFLALAVYDQPDSGGNGDGWIDSTDGIYPLLRVWLDENRDGASQPHELRSLEESGVTALGFEIFERRFDDEHGNAHRYWSTYLTPAGSRASVDVFLRTDEVELPRQPELDPAGIR